MPANKARIAGYAYALENSVDGVSEELAATEYAAKYPANERGAIVEAFERGVLDAVAGLQAEDLATNYITVDEAALDKNVAPNSLYKLLRDNDRRMKHFPRAIAEGEGTRRTWLLHRDEVEAWQPRNYPRD